MTPKTAPRIVGIIPARHASTRFPGKPLARLHHKPMIQWVHEGAAGAELLDDLLVATDDERIRDCVESFGGRAVMTSASHVSGTDRLAEVARDLEADIVVNIQGDEPLMSPEAIDTVARTLLACPGADMATLATRLREPSEFHDTGVVKVVTDENGRALYFSRAPIPHDRSRPGGVPAGALKHVGLYAYRRDFLLTFQRWPPSQLETSESLEQLRALEHGATIQVAVTDLELVAIDEPADVAVAEARLRSRLQRTTSCTGEN